jgi:hypothetical protein
MKFGSFWGPGKQSRDQSADNGPCNAQQCCPDETEVRVHNRTCDQSDNKPDDNRPKNVYHINSCETLKLARRSDPGLQNLIQARSTQMEVDLT